jgi:hypothetical protein
MSYNVIITNESNVQLTVELIHVISALAVDPTVTEIIIQDPKTVCFITSKSPNGFNDLNQSTENLLDQLKNDGFIWQTQWNDCEDCMNEGMVYKE